MSKWKDIHTEDLSLSDDLTELHIQLEPDDNGNNYLSVNVDDILILLDEEREAHREKGKK